MTAPDPTFRCPRPPDWKVDWDGLVSDHPPLLAFRGCPQDPVHHAEGDVWTHVQMVLHEMAALPAWRALAESERVELFAAAVLHDIAKPATTQTVDGRIGSPKHSLVGQFMSRVLMWRMGFAFESRERVAAMVRHHQRPFYLVDRPDARRLAIGISTRVRCDRLAILAEADARGRECADKQRILDNIALFAEFCREEGCADRPYAFPSDHTRFVYFRTEDRPPEIPVHDDTRCEVTLMSGLPGSGKDHWIARHAGDLPVVSLDDLRDEMDEPSTGNQGAVVDAARELARDHLRHRRSFVWNATSLSRQLRRQCIDLFAAYHARVRIVYVEAPAGELSHRNRLRPRPVPADALEFMIHRRWEVPDLTEAHRVDRMLG